MDRVSHAVEFREQLRDELAQLWSTIRPEQLTLIELQESVAILRPVAQRAARE